MRAATPTRQLGVLDALAEFFGEMVHQQCPQLSAYIAALASGPADQGR